VPPRLSRVCHPWSLRNCGARNTNGLRNVPQAERAGVKPATIRDLHQGRVPKSAPKDERAIYDFVQELYKTRRVSDKNFKRVSAILGEAATVEFVGILGYYVLISMILNVFRMPIPEGESSAVQRRNRRTGSTGNVRRLVSRFRRSYLPCKHALLRASEPKGQPATAMILVAGFGFDVPMNGRAAMLTGTSDPSH